MRNLKTKSWISVVACAFAIFNTGALFFGYPGVMTPEWQKMFNVDSGDTGFIMTFACLGVGILMFVSGWINRKIGTRKCLLIGAALNISCIVTANFASGIIGIYVAAFLCGAGSGFIYGPGVTTVQNWMPLKKGIGSGILNLAFGIAGAIMSPVYSIMLNKWGYQTMNMVTIGLILLISGVTAAFAELPEFSRLSTEMKEELEKQKKEASSKGLLPVESMTPGKALKTRGFWALWLCWALVGAAGISMVSLSGKYGAVIGVSGVTILTAFNLTNGISRFVAGTVSDFLGRNTTCMIAFGLGAVGYIILPYTRSMVLVVVFAACVGTALGTLCSVTAARIADLFGLEHYSMLLALVFSGYGIVGGVAGPALSGLILTKTNGNYTIVFTMLGIFCLLSVLIITQARLPKKEVKAEMYFRTNS